MDDLEPMAGLEEVEARPTLSQVIASLPDNDGREHDEEADLEALKADFAAHLFDEEPAANKDESPANLPEADDDEEQFDEEFEMSMVQATVSASQEVNMEALKAQYDAELGDDDDAAAFDSRAAGDEENDDDDVVPARQHRKKGGARPVIEDDEDQPAGSKSPLFEDTGADYLDNQAGNDDDDDGIDIAAIKAKYEKQIFNDKPASPAESDVKKIEPEEKVKVVAAEPKLQRPFQPTATPVSLDQRYMVWNEVGIVRCFDLDNEHTINVEFHDTAVHHAIHYDNRTMQFTMAALSPDAFLMANRKVEGIMSSLFCMYFRSWDINKEWKAEMPEGENIECIALGGGFVAAATDARLVRLWTIGGVQLNIFCLPGNPVTMAAQEKSLMVIYHNGCPVPEDQNMAMYLLKIDPSTSMIKKQSTPNAIPVPLSSKSLLTWAGFTDEGTPCTTDLKGIVRIYTNYLGNTWLPIANLRDTIKNKSDHSFVIGLSEVQQRIRHIFCKGQRYPLTIPRPTVGLLPFEMPICGKHTSRGKQEEKYIRSKVSSHLLTKLLEDGYEVESYLDKSESEMGTALLHIFALTLKDKAESLAYEISKLLPNVPAVKNAIALAKSQKLRALAEKLVEVMQEKAEEVPDDLYEDENMQHQASPHKNSVILAEKPSGENHLKPKPLSQAKKRRNDEDEDEIQFLDEEAAAARMKPKPLGSSKTKKRSRDESDEENETASQQLQINRRAIIDYYFKENLERMREDNPDMDDDDLREIARDELEALDDKERKQWEADAIRRLQRGKSKKVKA